MNQSWATRIWRWQNPTCKKYFFQNSQECLGQLPWVELPSFGGWFGSLGASGGSSGRYSMGPKCSRGAIYFSASIHTRKLFFWLKALYPYSMLPFESHWPTWHLPFLPSTTQSQSEKIPNRPKCSRGAIYFSASIHTRKLSFWLKALYPYSMLPFECHWPTRHLPFLARSGQSRDQSVKIRKKWSD